MLDVHGRAVATRGVELAGLHTLWRTSARDVYPRVAVASPWASCGILNLRPSSLLSAPESEQDASGSRQSAWRLLISVCHLMM